MNNRQLFLIEFVKARDIIINFFIALFTFHFYDYEIIKKECVLIRDKKIKKNFDRKIIVRTSRVTGSQTYKYRDGFMFNNPWNNRWRNYSGIKKMKVLQYVEYLS